MVNLEVRKVNHLNSYTKQLQKAKASTVHSAVGRPCLPTSLIQHALKCIPPHAAPGPVSSSFLKTLVKL